MSTDPPILTLVLRKEPEPTPLSARDDDELMLCARGGSGAAFDELVRRYQPRVMRIAARYLGQPAAAKDVAQATFVELYRALPRYQPRGQLSSYLFRVLINQCHMARRSQRAMSQAFESLAAQPGPTVGLPDEQILVRERAREVERALGRLSTKLRDVLVLRFSGELSYDEVAAALALPLGTVKRRMFDGLERMRAIMEEEDDR